LIDAVTPLQARVAFDQLDGTLSDRLREIDRVLLDLIAPLEASLDFPEEGYHFIAPGGALRALDAAVTAIDDLLAAASRGRVIREGRTVLTEKVDVGGIPFTFVDTAGVRDEAGDAIEEEGIARARQAGAAADLRIVVLDRSRPLIDEDRALIGGPTDHQIVVASKCDLAPRWDAGSVGALPISSVTGEGIDALRDALVSGALVAGETTRDRPALANLRHAALLERARTMLEAARVLTQARAPEEVVLIELYNARALFDELTGARPQDEVLRTIFGRFCIGK
jgi:tRNA modification GTPase